MSYDHLSWILVLMSVAGNIFVIKKNVIGLWLWTIANVGWVAYNLYIGSYSQASLFAFYFCLSVWGIMEWSSPNGNKNQPQKA